MKYCHSESICLIVIFTARRYASAVDAVIVCLYMSARQSVWRKSKFHKDG